MKIIHCSDLHLDSKMNSNLNKEKQKERRNEILITFQKMIQYAKKEKVKIILIAGDLFDSNKISVKAKNIVKDAIISNEEIEFLYLRGNHDEADFLEEETDIPKNLKLFNKEKWTTYSYENIKISGIEFGKKSDFDIYNSLILDKNDINIVCLHGQESKYEGKDKAEIINIQNLKNKNIDYLALGHIHKYKEQKLDSRGVYCYSGCLEGRGFDECGEKGFVLLNIENNKVEREFIPFAERTLHEINVDITNTNTTSEAIDKIECLISEIPSKDLVKIVLSGKVELESERDINYMVKIYQDRFYFIKIYDETDVLIDYERYENDASLKGEFIRLVLSEKLSEKEKKEIIVTGIKALSGEEVD